MNALSGREARESARAVGSEDPEWGGPAGSRSQDVVVERLVRTVVRHFEEIVLGYRWLDLDAMSPPTSRLLDQIRSEQETACLPDLRSQVFSTLVPPSYSISSTNVPAASD